MDAVSDQDFMFDFLYAASMITLHLSQFCESYFLVVVCGWVYFDRG